jgi:hypothetical protein
MMIVSFTGPRGGNIDSGLEAFATLAIRSFSKQLKIDRLKMHIEVKFYHSLWVDKDKTCEGLCEAIDDRNFVIDVALYGHWLSTLAHEMAHVKQFARHELNESLTRWKNKNCSNIEYWDQPWEKEARKLQKVLVQKFQDE